MRTWGAHRLEIVDIVDGEILRDVKQKIVRKDVKGHEGENMVDGEDGRRSEVTGRGGRGSRGYGKWQRRLLICAAATLFLIRTTRPSADLPTRPNPHQLTLYIPPGHALSHRLEQVPYAPFSQVAVPGRYTLPLLRSTKNPTIANRNLVGAQPSRRHSFGDSHPPLIS